MKRAKCIGMNAAFSRAENRAEHTSLSFKPSNPNGRFAAIGRSIPDDKLIFDVVKLKSEIPTKILLVWLGIRLNAASTKCSNEPASQIVAIAAIVDEIVPALRCIERGTLKSNECAEFRHMLNGS